MRLPRMLAALLFTLVLAAFPAAPAHAAAIGVTTTADELNSDGDCSLREAIRAANLNAAVDACPAGDGADTIALPAGIYTLTIAGYDDAALMGDFDITESLTITGALSTTTVIDGGGLDAVFDIIGGNVTLSGLTMRKGDYDSVVNRTGAALTVVKSMISNSRYNGIRSNGALTVTQSLISNNAYSGIYSYGRAVISDSVIRDNNLNNPTDSSGGGIYNIGSMLLTNSSVISNTASHGGGIDNSGNLTVTYSLISDNLASRPIGNEAGVGGGIFSGGGMLIVEHSSIIHNQAINHAGGIYSEGAAHITNTIIANNGAMRRAGGIEYKGVGIMTLTDSIVRSNTATSYAGGILAYDALVIDGTSIISNSAGFNGGGIFSYGRTTITRSLIQGNTAINGGGIIDIAYPGQRRLTLVSDSIISSNSAMRGGGINNSGHVQIINSAIVSNTATEDGGGIYNNQLANYTNVLTATNSTISGNDAGRHGGGIYNITGTLSLYNATLAHNTADFDNDGTGDGGGVMQGSGTVALQNSILGANSDQGGQAGDCSGALLSQGYNLIQDSSGCTLTGTTDILGLPPLLGPLGDNGGPTLTHALLPDSPALDAGDPAGCRDAEGTLLADDQRGSPRPVGGACDIGAFEAALVPQTVPVYLPLIAGP
jgi:CSLREA domain-containing protein